MEKLEVSAALSATTESLQTEIVSRAQLVQGSQALTRINLEDPDDGNGSDCNLEDENQPLLTLSKQESSNDQLISRQKFTVGIVANHQHTGGSNLSTLQEQHSFSKESSHHMYTAAVSADGDQFASQLSLTARDECEEPPWLNRSRKKLLFLWLPIRMD